MMLFPQNVARNSLKNNMKKFINQMGVDNNFGGLASLEPCANPNFKSDKAYQGNKRDEQFRCTFSISDMRTERTAPTVWVM